MAEPVYTEKIIDLIREVTGNPALAVSSDSRLLGDGSVIDSMSLVGLCLALEDYADTLGFAFDWTSETALSKSRSMYRTVSTLADAFCAQKDASRS